MDQHHFWHLAIRLFTVAALAGTGVCRAFVALWRNENYWWVAASGFSIGTELADAVWSCLFTLFLLGQSTRLLAKCCGETSALVLHFLAAAILSTLSIADLVLAVVAGGARISLPLILFTLCEMGYVINVVRPWLSFAMPVVTCLVLATTAVSCAAASRISRANLPARVAPIAWPVFGILCLARIIAIVCNSDGKANHTDLISKLLVDGGKMSTGAFKSSSGADVLSKHLINVSKALVVYPPILFFHWEAGGAVLLKRAIRDPRVAPFLSNLTSRAEVFTTQAFVAMPMTLKSAWEVLCGIPPALTSDFREHGSSLRRECLPRVLARCCGYHTLLAKTDVNLPNVPRRVFGFHEVLIAPTSRELVDKIRARLDELGALKGERPVFLYFYASDAHAPYDASRVSPDELGYDSELVMDIYFALQRRADDAALRLDRFWPPRRPNDAGPWTSENGLSFYFGDHGESLSAGREAQPHGNSVSAEVAEVFVLADFRSFRPPYGLNKSTKEGRVHCLEDIFATVIHCLGLCAEGPLHVGRSLLQTHVRRFVSTFSFYRPDEVAAVHVWLPDGNVQTIEIVRGVGRWVPRHFGNDLAENAVSHSDVVSVLEARATINNWMTESNIHAAWMLVRLQHALRTVARFLQRPMELIR